MSTLEDQLRASSSESESDEEEVESDEAGGKGKGEEEDGSSSEDNSDDDSDGSARIPEKSKPNEVESDEAGGKGKGEEEDEDEDEDGSSFEDNSDDDSDGSAGIPEKSKPNEVEKTVSSKPSSSGAVVAPISLKRPTTEEKDGNQSKKKKNRIDQQNGVGSSSQPVQNKKKLFGRVWSEDDEVVILEGMLDCYKQGDDPFAKLDRFFDSIKKSISFTFNKDQLKNKMRRLKKKFDNQSKRGKGSDLKIPHEKKCYELSRVIWDGAMKKSAKPKRIPSSLKQKTVANDISSDVSKDPILAAALRLGKNFPYLQENVLKQGLALLGDSEVKQMESEWNIQQQAEVEVSLKRIDLMREHTAKVLDRIRASNP